MALFFVTIGALVDPRILISKPALWGTIVVLTMVGKFVIWTLIVWLFRYPPRTALLVGLGLTQIGEFSYVLVRVARDAHLVTDDMYHATLAASVITILLNGLLMKALPRTEAPASRRSSAWSRSSRPVGRIQHASRRIRYSSNRHMATRSKPASESAATGVLDAPNGERERIFDPFRHWGYLEADLDPLGFLPPVPHPDLRIEGELAEEARRIYCGTVGAEFMHITDPERRRWIQERMEGPQPAVDQERVLDQLIRADLFEQVLQQRYLGNKRFSLEGVTALIPLVDEILDAAGQRGAVELVMGMSHRGRLNVIVQVAKRAPEEIFAGFEDVDPRSVLGSGDVKYHMGATGEYVTRSGTKIHIHLVSNPSHLEAVDPVTVGRTRAKQDRAGRRRRSRNSCLCWSTAMRPSRGRASWPRP